MKGLGNLLDKDMILLDKEANNKEEIINISIKLLGKNKHIKNKEAVLSALLKRESMGTTGIGHGVALPHARTSAVSQIVLAFIRTKNGIDFGAVDKELVNLIFIAVSPENDTDSYMEVMASVARILSKEENRKLLMEVESPKKLISVIKEIESF
ncbi:MAG: PTS sugar transporter subunit IIA [bacterium]|nr:PTS sugar transporter subunit IIA [bacterium]